MTRVGHWRSKARASAPHAIGLLAIALAVTACGLRKDLAVPKGANGPAVPAGTTRAPTPAELTTPSAQAQPSRSDEVLRRSEERGEDPFDLPPTR